MVIISFPAAAETGIEHERSGFPPMCTVHAPHWAIPQPYFVPVRPTKSRRAHNKGIFGSASMVYSFELTLSLMDAMVGDFYSCRRYRIFWGNGRGFYVNRFVIKIE